MKTWLATGKVQRLECDFSSNCTVLKLPWNYDTVRFRCVWWMSFLKCFEMIKRSSFRFTVLKEEEETEPVQAEPEVVEQEEAEEVEFSEIEANIRDNILDNEPLTNETLESILPAWWREEPFKWGTFSSHLFSYLHLLLSTLLLQCLLVVLDFRTYAWCLLVFFLPSLFCF